MDFLIDLLPVALFFLAYRLYDLFTATGVLIAACFAVVLLKWLRTRKIPWVAVVTAVVAAVLGGITLKLHDPLFIQYKPTLIYGAFSLLLLASHFIGGKVLLARLPQQLLVMPDAIWRRVNLAWAGFFAFCAAVNIYVLEHFSEAVWVNVHTFGFSGLMFVFVMLHLPFLMRYIQEEPKEPALATEPTDGSR